MAKTRSRHMDIAEKAVHLVYKEYVKEHGKIPKDSIIKSSITRAINSEYSRVRELAAKNLGYDNSTQDYWNVIINNLDLIEEEIIRIYKED